MKPSCDQNSFEFVTVAAARARQLLDGCMPKVEGSPKPHDARLQEVAAAPSSAPSPSRTDHEVAFGCMAFVGLGVTGGIGAYKAVEVARLLQKRGHRVAGGHDAHRPALRRPADVRGHHARAASSPPSSRRA